jgi:carboxypeptidase family protein/TonB-dependent receptor-like protein
MKSVRIVVCFLAVLLVSVSVFAQLNFGRILGTVTDQSGAVMTGAKVSIIDTQRGLARTLTTDQAGEYNAPTLIPGTYTVRVEAQGFKTLDRQNVLVEVGKEVRVDLTPEPGSQTQTVTITEAVPLVDAASATLGGTVSNADVNDLPLNGRNFQGLLGLRPGVMLQPGGSPWTQSTNNVRPDETGWMVDGILNANAFDARPVAGASSAITDGATILPLDAIQEFNTMENPKAEFGGKPGALVNVGIRSGTNTLHGSAYAYGRNGDWDARNVFNPAPNDVLPLDLEQYGGALGGPIKKDKLFFFGNYEALHSFLGNALGTAVPYTGAGSPADPKRSMVDAIHALQAAGVKLSPVSLKILGCAVTPSVVCTGGLIENAPANSSTYISTYPNSNNSYNGIGKVDYRVNDKHMINGLLYRAIYNATGEDFPQVNHLWTNIFPGPVWTASGNWIWTASSSLVNEFRIGWNQSGFGLLPADTTLKPDGKDYPLNTGITSTGGFPAVYIRGLAPNFHLGSQPGRPLESNGNPYWNFQDHVSYLKGRHAFKFGLDIARVQANANVHDTRGRIYFQGGQVSQIKNSTQLEDFFAGIPARGQQLVGNPNLEVISHSYGGFFQDDWRIAPKIMLNLGLRYAYASPFHEVNNALGNFDPALGMVQQGQASVGDSLVKPDYGNWSPRLGIAWDVTGKGTTVIRAGAGIYYSVFSLAPLTANPGPANVPGGTSLGAVPTGACTTAVPVGTPCPKTFGGTIAVGQAKLPGSALNWDPGPVFPTGAVLSCTAANQCSVGGIDPHLKTPRVGSWNFGIQHAFTNNLSLDVSYVGTHGDRLVGARDINQADLVTGDLPYASKYPYLQFINYGSNQAWSNYHSLQSTLVKRVSHGLNFTIGYTYGHGLDNGSLNRFGGLPQDSLHPEREYASSDFDIRHRATFTASYEIPGPKGYGQLLHGWKLNTIVTLAGSQPYNIIDTSDDFSGTGEFTDRWNFYGNPSDFKSQGAGSLPYCTGPGADGCSVTSGVSGIQSYFSAAQSTAMWAQCKAVAPDPDTLDAAGCYVRGKSVMVPPKAGTFGTMGRNLFRDTGFKNVDFSVFKTFTFKERFGATFRAEFFNFFNHPIFSNPSGAVNGYNGGNDPSGTATFGCGCTTPDIAAGNPIVGSGDSRTIQLGFKLTF